MLVLQKRKKNRRRKGRDRRAFFWFEVESKNLQMV
jgi:hypothetical protein